MAVDLDERVTPAGKETDDEFSRMMNSPDNADLRDGLNSIELNPDDATAASEPEQNLLNYSDDEQAGKTKRGRGRLSKGGIGALLGGGGIIAILTFAMPNLAIGQFHSLLDKVFGGSATTQQTRAEQWLHNKIFGGTGKATSCSTLTYKCRITTMSKEEVATLKENGYELVDKDGNALKSDKNGRYSKASAVREIENPKNSFNANQLRKELGTNAKLNKAFSAIYPSRIAVLRDNIAQKIFGEKKLNRNPKTTEGDADPNTEEGRAKNAAKNFSQEQAQPSVTNNVDDGLRDAVGEAVTQEQNDILAGTTRTGASDILAVSELEPPKKNILTTVSEEAKGLAQGIPLEMTNMACTNYARAKLVVNVARLAGTAAAVAYGIHLFTVFEKVMANSSTPEESATLTNDVSNIMNTLNRQDSAGNSASDSAGYWAYMYNQISSNPITSPITGGALLTAIVSFVMFFKKMPNVDQFCTLFVSPAGQVGSVIVGLAAQVVAFILSGSATGFAEIVGRVGIKEAAKVAAKDVVEKAVGKALENITKEDIKLSLKTLGKQIAKSAATAGGIMVISYLVDAFVVPYIAKVATGTITGTDTSGIAAMDTAINGLGALNAQVGLGRGETTMTKSDYLQFSKYVDQQQQEYIAMQRSISNPFDIANPYSVSGSIAAQAYPSLSKLDIFSNPSNIASLPMNILGMLSSSRIATTTAYAATTDQREELLSQCQDQDMVSDRDIALDIFCNPFVGFNDLGMLQNTSTADVFDYMESHNQVDENNQPLPGSEYEKFYKDCVEGVENKTLSTLVEGEDQIAPRCIDPTYNSREDIKYFRLATIDSSIDKGLTSPTATATGQCPAGTTLVSGITKGWEKNTGKEQTITLCAIPGTTMTGNPDWSDSRYVGTTALGVKEISINSKGAASLLQLAQKAKSQDSLSLTASIGYRSLYEQCSIYIRTNASPGGDICPSWIKTAGSGWTTDTLYSNHMMGYSIDFVDSASKKWMKDCVYSTDTSKYDGKADNRCFGFWDDVWQTRNWDEGHFTYDP